MIVEIGDNAADPVVIGDGSLSLLAGPCVIEGRDHALRHAETITAIAARHGIDVIYKSSFDKANRTSINGERGPGIDDGLEILAEVGNEFGVPVVTDIHESHQAAEVAEVVDLLQIPAFLCRQTDLLVAAAATGRAVNVKKGQFLAPVDMAHVVDKLSSAGCDRVLVTERGTSFGYHDLVVDFRALPALAALDRPVVFDATHSVQRPSAGDGKSGGDRTLVPHLAAAAVAIGVDALFLEVHEDPDNAPSDGPNMVPLCELDALLERLIRLHHAAR